MELTAQPPYRLVEPRGDAVAVVLSSPHSGRFYPPDLMASLRLPLVALRALEDGPVDHIAEYGCDAGAVLIAATLPRAYVDLNRAPDELDPQLVEGLPQVSRLSAKVQAGLGVIPSRIGLAPLYRRSMSWEDARQRLQVAHAPYHEQLRSLLVERVRLFGIAVLVDCHSMPSGLAGEHGRTLDVALGDRFGRSSHPALSQLVHDTLSNEGLRVGRNKPYAGGFITEHYGQPWHDVSALQVEFQRSLFMDEATHEPHADLGGLPQVLDRLVRALAALAANLAGRRSRLAKPLALGA
jgi:N-formylglutamate amidohydrolase